MPRRIMTRAEEVAYFRWPRPSAAAGRRVQQLIRRGETSWSASVVEPFERDLAELFGVRHALCCSNGTSAAYLAVRALGLGPGDSVIAAALGHPASVLPALQCRARVRLADVRPGTCHLDPDAVEGLVDGSTRAVVVTHLFGTAAPVEELRALCARRGLALIEDVAHAQGARHGGRPLGSLGDVAFTSFQAQKLISGGEGGALLTDRQDLCGRALALGHPRRLRSAPETWQLLAAGGEGFKFTPSALLVALAHDALRGLPGQNAVRRAACEQFRRLLAESGLFVAPAPRDEERVYYRCEATLAPGPPAAAAARILAALRAQGVRVDRYWGYLPDLPALRDGLGVAGGDGSDGLWPVAQDAWQRTLLFDPFTAYDPGFVGRYAARVVAIARAESERTA